VVVSIAGWNPETNLPSWLAARLHRDFPHLRPARAGDPDLAAALVGAGLILPILDGFDEMPPALHRSALRALNSTVDRPLVLTSRREEYAAAVAGTDVLTAAAGIELDPLTLDDLADYLPRTTRRVTVHDGRTTDLWSPVLDHLRRYSTDPASQALVEALSTPLMISLARSVYSDIPEHTPLDLLDVVRFPTTQAIEDHLVAAYLPAAYARHGPPGRAWTSDQAHRWLAYIARHLEHLHTRDLAWWQLRDTVPRTIRILSFGLAAWLVTWIGTGLTAGNWSGSSGLLTALVFGPMFGGPSHGPPPARFHMQIRARWRNFLPGFLLGFAGGLAIGILSVPLLGSTGASIAGLALGIAGGLGVGTVNGLQGPVDVDAAADPASTLAAARRHGLSIMLIVGLLAGLGAGLLLGFANARAGNHFAGSIFGSPSFDLATAGLAALAAGLLTALFTGLWHAWMQWLILVRIWLPVAGHLPWRIEAFLTDARARGVLRQTGAVFQFRHVRLQQHLADPTRRP
jgi:hypothetical protein